MSSFVTKLIEIESKINEFIERQNIFEAMRIVSRDVEGYKRRQGYRFVGAEMTDGIGKYKVITNRIAKSIMDFDYIYSEKCIFDVMELYTLHLVDNFEEPHPDTFKRKK